MAGLFGRTTSAVMNVLFGKRTTGEPSAEHRDAPPEESFTNMPTVTYEPDGTVDVTPPSPFHDKIQ